jgi:hypothetical protein
MISPCLSYLRLLAGPLMNAVENYCCRASGVEPSRGMLATSEATDIKNPVLPRVGLVFRGLRDGAILHCTNSLF